MLMRILDVTPVDKQRELAERSGMGLGRLNFCLKALVAKGLVKLQKFAQFLNKLVYAYVLTPYCIAEKTAITRRFLLRKMEEYDSLKAEIKALKAEPSEEQTDSLRRQAQ